MGILDLYIHSNCSNDGEFSVAELIDKCKAAKLEFVSITDHNNANGINEAIKYGEKAGIQVIPGIEIDCSFENLNLHLLGYNIDYSAQEFIDLNNKMDNAELVAIPKMVENIKSLGFNIEYEEVLEKAGDTIPVGEFIAEVLLDKPENINDEKLKPYRNGG